MAISHALALPFTLRQVHKLHMYGRWFVCCKSNNIDDVGSAVASNVEIPLVNTSLTKSVKNNTFSKLYAYQGNENGFFVDKICKLSKFCKIKRTNFENRSITEVNVFWGVSLQVMLTGITF